ncbi:MAG: LPXTG cell wall anchor domain-containing protein [Clostridia bacterium]|nr:LPXTG cell wall anchor domain-containing protein [Clostridia bacterium]
MKKIAAIFLVCIIAISSVLPVYAADGRVTYSGNAGNFVFEPGSEHSLTDLFPNFKAVMPGDNLTQKITVKNNADNKVKVKIYIRSLGAHEDSADFLSQLGLKVKQSADNKMAYMFDAAANEKAQLTDWVCLGTLYSGGEVNLDVSLDVPTELPNEYQNKIGYLDWEFMIEEFPIDDGDPQPPQTGDNSTVKHWFAVMIGSLIAVVFLLVWSKRNKEKKKAI